MTGEPALRYLLTIGHSRHPLADFLGLLARHQVDVLVDVRSHPVSRFSPQFSRHALERALSSAAIGYQFQGDALGGRPRSPACYRPDGTLDYDLVEAQDFYQRGIAELLASLPRARVCVLCAEEDPSDCHRRQLITRTVAGRGVAVHHIRGSGALEAEADLRAREPPRQLSLLDPSPPASPPRPRRRRA